ncbi:hypothetical protein BC831DRAFT_402404 [Entophlyctis helioformis]|nr:hypothetical protein BC831DRAFT_402404 [Entophlyctis helioformis]
MQVSPAPGADADTLPEPFYAYAPGTPARPPPADDLSRLPLELLLRALGHLSPADLLTMSGVSALFHELSQDESLWKAHCAADWADKKHRRLRLFPYYAYTSSVILSRMSRADCEAVLGERGVDMAAMPEAQSLEDAADDEAKAAVLRPVVVRTTPFFAVRATSLSKWKASYYAARIDSTRTVMSEHELTSFEWYYCDSWGHYGYGQEDDDDEPKELTADELKKFPVVKFFKNGLRGPLEGHRPRTCSWTLSDTGHVQVSQYPPHRVRRTPTWGWEIANGWVTYRSK